MIGLGSNRLSVCRRGGMRVTQAGKGGMEWLAGNGFRSPYSAQATAALKAQFPTQWPTIRDYGFAHPEIVGYMNAYAPEDAKIAYSLVEGIGTRKIYPITSQAYMDTKIVCSANFKFRLTLTIESTTAGILGYRAGEGTYTRIFYLPGSLYAAFARQDANTSRYQNSITYTTGSTHTIEFDGNNLYSDGTLLGISKGTDYNPSQTLKLFVEDSRYGNFRLTDAELTDPNNVSHKFVPFQRNGQMELLDLVSGNLATRVGTFTELIESPS